MRLRWEITDETIALVRAANGLAKLGDDSAESLAAALRSAVGFSSTDRKAAAKTIDAVVRRCGLTTPQAKALWDALAVRDPEAPPVTDKKGNAAPDADLRDGENVPLPAEPLVFEADPSARLATLPYRTAVEDYLTAEVLPYVPDAWVDHDKTKIAYEVPLTRHFYKYVPPRPLAEIDAEIKGLEAEIQRLLAEVTE